MSTFATIATTLAVLGPAVGLMVAPIGLVALALPVLLVAVVLAAVLVRPVTAAAVPVAAASR